MPHTGIFFFDLPIRTRARVEVNLFYLYSPRARSEAQQRLKFHSMSRLIQIYIAAFLLCCAELATFPYTKIRNSNASFCELRRGNCPARYNTAQ